MARYVVKRLLLMIPTLLGVAVLIFLLMRVVPGDSVELRSPVKGRPYHARISTSSGRGWGSTLVSEPTPAWGLMLRGAAVQFADVAAWMASSRSTSSPTRCGTRSNPDCGCNERGVGLKRAECLTVPSRRVKKTWSDQTH